MMPRLPAHDSAADQPLRVGVDLVEVERIRRACRRWGERFMQRVYTAHEREVADGRYGSLASRFAAKEATAKALGVGIGAIQWRDVEVVRDAAGEPKLVLRGTAAGLAEELGLTRFAVSLSDTRELAVAVVVAQ